VRGTGGIAQYVERERGTIKDREEKGIRAMTNEKKEGGNLRKRIAGGREGG